MTSPPAGRILVAPDKFKGTLSAPLVAAHVAAGLRDASPGAEAGILPVADGGDGFREAAVSARFRDVTVSAVGPTGLPVRASYGVGNGSAVVELAETAGLVALPGNRRAPMQASSYGTGLVPRAALDAGCRSVLLGLGGSAWGASPEQVGVKSLS